jgi:hypothetical protein
MTLEKDGRNEENATSSAGIAKWVVLGIASLTFMVLFRAQLGGLLERLSGIEFEPSSKAVKIKFLDTPLGKTEVSTVKTSSDQIGGIHGSTYTSRQYSFQISWPSGGNWQASDSYGRTLHQQLGLPPTLEIPVVIMKNELVGNFRPNVNVVVETIGNMSLRQYMDLSIQSMQQMGWTILSSSIDEATQGGLLVFMNKSFGDGVYQFQRHAVAFGRAYVVTASQLPPTNLISEQLQEELRGILNSFRLTS